MIGHNSEEQDIEKILKLEVGNDSENVHGLSSEKNMGQSPCPGKRCISAQVEKFRTEGVHYNISISRNKEL